jgi:hypothetical protein
MGAKRLEPLSNFGTVRARVEACNGKPPPPEEITAAAHHAQEEAERQVRAIETRAGKLGTPAIPEGPYPQRQAGSPLR